MVGLSSLKLALNVMLSIHNLNLFVFTLVV